jgi:spore maturation protein SpmA
MMDGLFEASKNGFELSIFMTGALCLWMGFMKIGEEGGAIKIMSKLVAPLFTRLFPEIPKDHPAVGSIMMNFSANMLGLDNAATPFGLKVAVCVKTSSFISKDNQASPGNFISAYNSSF